MSSANPAVRGMLRVVTQKLISSDVAFTQHVRDFGPLLFKSLLNFRCLGYVCLLENVSIHYTTVIECECASIDVY